MARHDAFFHDLDGIFVGGLLTNSTTKTGGVFAGFAGIPWLATFRGRIGLDLDSTFVYVTGGLAVGKVENSFNSVTILLPELIPAALSTVAAWIPRLIRFGRVTRHHIRIVGFREGRVIPSKS